MEHMNVVYSDVHLLGLVHLVLRPCERECVDLCYSLFSSTATLIASILACHVAASAVLPFIVWFAVCFQERGASSHHQLLICNASEPRRPAQRHPRRTRRAL